MSPLLASDTSWPDAVVSIVTIVVVGVVAIVVALVMDR